MAYGRLGWSEEKFFESKLSYFFKALKGFNDLEFERHKDNWERFRFLASVTLAPHTAKGRSTNPKTLFPMPWDKDDAKLWRERNKEILDRCDEMIRNERA